MSERVEGTIMKGVGGLYTVRLPLKCDVRYVTCPARGKFRHENVTPYPGDRVVLEKDGDAWAVADVLERRTTLHRPAVENVTHLVAVIPAAKPKADLETADKLICCAESAGIEPIIAVNKADLDRAEAERIRDVYEKAGFTVFLLSAAVGEGVDELREHLFALAGKNADGTDKPDDAGAAEAKTSTEDGETDAAEAKTSAETGETAVAEAETSVEAGETDIAGADGTAADAIADTYEADGGAVSIVFSGASGAGKSTLMTGLFPHLDLRTGDVSRKTERGRHTTRAAELFEIADGLFLADTPGFTMLDFANFNFFPQAELAYLFREFQPYIGECRYTKCTHLCEEGCRVCEAVESGEIPRERHENYRRIYAEMKKTPEWKRRRMEW